jgi:SAM-dependent methyltransferase
VENEQSAVGRRGPAGVEEPQETSEKGRVQAHWNETLPELDLTFYGFPPLRPYLYRCITGHDPVEPLGRDWFERWAVDEIVASRAPVGDCLSLCCGFGEIERILARLGAFERCVAVDIAPAAIAAAQSQAAVEGLDGLTYRVLDAETATFEPASVDLVWANGALHHLGRLEHVVAECYRALKPGGLLVANEYVGPDHHQLDRRARELVNAISHLIPEELRDRSEAGYLPERIRGPRWRELGYRLLTGRISDGSLPGGWMGHIAQARLRLPRRRPEFGPVFSNNPWYYSHVDPSEGVRASAIVDTLRMHFADVDVRPYNGTLLPHVLGRRFYEAYDPANASHVELISMLTDLEVSLIAASEVSPHHAVIVCRKPV